MSCWRVFRYRVVNPCISDSFLRGQVRKFTIGYKDCIGEHPCLNVFHQTAVHDGHPLTLVVLSPMRIFPSPGAHKYRTPILVKTVAHAMVVFLLYCKLDAARQRVHNGVLHIHVSQDVDLDVLGLVRVGLASPSSTDPSVQTHSVCFVHICRIQM